MRLYGLSSDLPGSSSPGGGGSDGLVTPKENGVLEVSGAVPVSLSNYSYCFIIIVRNSCEVSVSPVLVPLVVPLLSL